jgi:hypothetical protein
VWSVGERGARKGATAAGLERGEEERCEEPRVVPARRVRPASGGSGGRSSSCSAAPAAAAAHHAAETRRGETRLGATPPPSRSPSPAALDSGSSPPTCQLGQRVPARSASGSDQRAQPRSKQASVQGGEACARRARRVAQAPTRAWRSSTVVWSGSGTPPAQIWAPVGP